MKKLFAALLALVLCGCILTVVVLADTGDDAAAGTRNVVMISETQSPQTGDMGITAVSMALLLATGGLVATMSSKKD